jgi:hypothetical protein
MVDPQIATGAATAAYRIGTLEEPGPHFEAKISAGECADGTNVYDVHRVWIGERDVFVNPDLRLVPTVKHLNFVRMGHIASETNTARAQNASFLIQFYAWAKGIGFPAARFFSERVAAVMSG